VQRGLLIRGAITKGPLHHDGDFVFGPALNEAAELEKVAMYPRVIVTQELLVDAGIVKVGGAVVRHELSRRPSSLVARDLDGVYFVDYFSAHPDDFSDDWGELVEYLISLREMIRGLAAMKQPSVRLKHSWLRQKFNDIAEPLERSRYGILGAHAVPEDEEDHIVNVSPFR
jgi:hypothetical protein